MSTKRDKKKDKAMATTKPAHPEFLETEADYAAAPGGTIVSLPGGLAWTKEADNDWGCSGGSNEDYSMSENDPRSVLRWGWGDA